MKIARNLVPLLGILVTCACMVAVGAESEYKVYKDPTRKIGARIRDLMGRMTLEEKIGQMTQVDRENLTAAVVGDFSFGGLLSGAGSAPRPNATAEEWIEMINGFQKGALLSSRLGIPIIYGSDVVHGNNNVYKATIFPHNIGLGATRDPELVRRIGAATALEARATGIPYVFGPCVSVCRDPRWGRCYETFSEDVEIVREMTSEIIGGLQGDIPPIYRKGVPYVGGKTKVAACARNFVGDGGTTKGKDENDTVIGWHELLSIHMPGFYHSIIKGISTIALSYNTFNGQKMHAHHYLITNFLKGSLKFRGFVISNWLGLDRITNPEHANYTYSVLKGIEAGIDMVMVPYNYTEFMNTLAYLVKNNYIPISRIDDAVKRILRVKFTLGLFENPLADHSLVHHVGSHAHRELAREAVRKSLVLLKNGKNGDETLLPLPKKASKILVAGTHAHNIGNQCGGWTITWQGSSGNNMTTGRPLVIEPYIPLIDALVVAWLPGTEGGGIADVLFGDYPFTGKLPHTWFKNVQQLPMNVGDSHYDPLFPFGFGLTTKV